MKNYVQRGDTITVVASATTVGGAVVAIGDLIGIAAGDAALGEPLDVVTVGVFDLVETPEAANTMLKAIKQVFKFAVQYGGTGPHRIEIMAITGHQTSKEVTRYTKAAPQRLCGRRRRFSTWRSWPVILWIARMG